MFKFKLKVAELKLDERRYRKDTVDFVFRAYKTAAAAYYRQIQKIIPVKTGFMLGSYSKLGRWAGEEGKVSPKFFRGKALRTDTRLPIGKRRAANILKKLTSRQTKKRQKVLDFQNRQLGRVSSKNMEKYRARTTLINAAEVAKTKYYTRRQGKLKYKSRGRGPEMYYHFRGAPGVIKTPHTGHIYTQIKFTVNGAKYQPGTEYKNAKFQFLYTNSITYLMVNVIRRGWAISVAYRVFQEIFRRELARRDRPKIGDYIIRGSHG
jgi:hypothetical protein